MPTLFELERAASTCTLCPLSQSRTKVVFGEGAAHASVMIIGEAPGRDEDLAGRPFVGRSGKLLDRLIAEEMQLEREQVYIANVVKCRPPGNRDPAPVEIESCRPYLDEQLALIKPAVLITLGNFSTRLVLKTTEGIRKLRGRTYPLPDGGPVVVPTLHPAAALRGGGVVLAEMRADFVRAKQAAAGGGARLDGA